MVDAATSTAPAQTASTTGASSAAALPKMDKLPDLKYAQRSALWGKSVQDVNYSEKINGDSAVNLYYDAARIIQKKLGDGASKAVGAKSNSLDDIVDALASKTQVDIWDKAQAPNRQASYDSKDLKLSTLAEVVNKAVDTAVPPKAQPAQQPAARQPAAENAVSGDAIVKTYYSAANQLISKSGSAAAAAKAVGARTSSRDDIVHALAEKSGIAATGKSIWQIAQNREATFNAKEAGLDKLAGVINDAAKKAQTYKQAEVPKPAPAKAEVRRAQPATITGDGISDRYEEAAKQIVKQAKSAGVRLDEKQVISNIAKASYLEKLTGQSYDAISRKYRNSEFDREKFNIDAVEKNLAKVLVAQLDYYKRLEQQNKNQQQSDGKQAVTKGSSPRPVEPIRPAQPAQQDYAQYHLSKYRIERNVSHPQILDQNGNPVLDRKGQPKVDTNRQVERTIFYRKSDNQPIGGIEILHEKKLFRDRQIGSEVRVSKGVSQREIAAVVAQFVDFKDSVMK